MSTNASTFPVECGDMEAVLDTSRFGPGGRSRCVLYGGQWISLTHFEDIAGKGSNHNWKRSVRYRDRPLSHWIEQGRLKICPKICTCLLCRELATSSSTPPPPAAAAAEQKATTPKMPHLAMLKAQDYDSDSGISVSSCTKALKIDVGGFEEEDEETVEEEELSLDYTTMTQEALLSLSQSAAGEAGCSQMNVLLYILNRHSPSEDIAVVNEKVKNALRFLSRMGIVQKISIDGAAGDDSDSDEQNVAPNKDLPASPAKVEVTPKAAKKKVKKVPRPKDENRLLKTCSKEQKVKKEMKSKPKKLSAALFAICGSQQMSRHDVVKQVWQYVKKHDLQDPNQKSFIVCDDKLKAVTKKKRIIQTELLGSLKEHLSDV